jgi:tetratricopeptide (TPR) repeat protein
VREIVIAQLSNAQRRHYHLELADTLEDRASTLPEVLAFHLEAAEQRERAVERWIEAAKRAFETLAFDHAAQLFLRALQLVADPVRARVINLQRAEALAHAGKGPSAAEVYLALAEGAAGEGKIDLRRLAAEQLLLAGHITRGIALMDEISRAVGMGATRHGKPALFSVLLGRLMLRMRGLSFRLRPLAEVSDTDRVQLEVAWTIACSLSLIDPINGARYHNEHMLLALRVGEPRHLLRALTLETSFGATGGSQNAKRSTELIEAARHLMEVNGDHVSRGLFDLAQGIAAYLQGETEVALGHCDAALARFKEHCPGAVWETISATRFVIASLFCLGQYRRLGEVVPPLLASAEGTGNLYAGMCFRSAFSTVAWLVRDDPNEARRQLDHATAECSTGLFYLPHYNLLLGETFFDLYQGDPARAHQRWLHRWSALEASSLLRIGIVRAMAWELRAASACYLASQCKAQGDLDRAEQLLAEASSFARKLKADRMRKHAGTGILIDAAVHMLRGQTEAARNALNQAIEQLDRAKLHMTAAAARMRLGNITPHERGRALWLTGYRVFEREGVKQTERMLNLLAPGYACPEPAPESEPNR